MSYTQFPKYGSGSTTEWQGLKMPGVKTYEAIELGYAGGGSEKCSYQHDAVYVTEGVCVCVCHTSGISDHATAGGLLGLLLHLFITVFLSSTVGTAGEKVEGLFEWSKVMKECTQIHQCSREEDGRARKSRSLQ